MREREIPFFPFFSLIPHISASLSINSETNCAYCSIINKMKVSSKSPLILSLVAHMVISTNGLASNSRRAFIKTMSTAATTSLIVGGDVAIAQEEDRGFVVGGKPRLGDESIMAQKAHGTSEIAVQDSLRYGVSNKLADKICNFNRR